MMLELVTFFWFDTKAPKAQGFQTPRVAALLCGLRLRRTQLYAPTLVECELDSLLVIGESRCYEELARIRLTSA